MHLFSKHGFESVTVAEIAERAEIGRSTFFRYFADKPEVVFNDTETQVRAMTTATRAMLAAQGPTTGSLIQALAAVHVAALALGRHLDPGGDRDQFSRRVHLIDRNADLTARRFSKQHRLVLAVRAVLIEAGFSFQVAVMATQMVEACCQSAWIVAGTGTVDFRTALEEAFRQLTHVDGDALRRQLDSCADVCTQEGR